MTSGTIEMLEGAATGLTSNLKPVLAAAADVPRDLADYYERLSDPSQGSFALWVVGFGAIFIAAAVVTALLPGLLGRLRRRLLPDTANRGTRILRAFLADVLGLVVLLAILYGAHAAWVHDRSPRSELAVSLFGGLFHWRLLMLPIDVLLRPREAEARLIHAQDRHAGHLRQLAAWLLGIVVFAQATLRALFYSQMATPSVQFLALLLGIISAGLALFLVQRLQRALQSRAEAAPSAAAVAVGGHAAPVILQRLWHPLAVAFVLAAAAAWLLGVIYTDLSFYWSLVDSGAILLAVLVAQSVTSAWMARSAPDVRTREGQRQARRQRLIRRCLAVALWLVSAVLIVEIWMASLAQILPSRMWQASRGDVVSAALTLYVAYVLWQVVFMHTERQLPTLPQAVSDGEGPPPVASRIQTMMPVLRIFMLVTIAIVAALIALSNLGVNTTSLIAGASIFGLAISFGSQSLVHDIVSGIFFMADDAFRIGEYIDTGKAKGTVEDMSVRSLRLRHQNGQIHVIPFGQIQQVTNFSRDWTTVKFNLTLAIDTDVDKVRKAVKQIGIEMMEDPTLAAELIQPLKMQGVTEIGTNGLVVRLKFTARPLQPTLIQREALKRITKRFREKGIEFASSNMVVQTITGPAMMEEVVKQPVALPAPAVKEEAQPAPMAAGGSPS